MHELSIALNILEIVTDTALKNNVRRVNEIEIDVGEISGVEIEALETALQSAVKNTLAGNAKITIHKIQPEAICNKCQFSFHPDDFFTVCPSCSSFDIEYIKGKEIRVRSIQSDIG